MSQIGDDKYRTCTTAKGCKIECLYFADPAGLIQIRSKPGSHWITADHSKDKNIATVDICSQEAECSATKSFLLWQKPAPLRDEAVETQG